MDESTFILSSIVSMTDDSICKGYDCGNIERTEIDPLTLDEIKMYIDTR